MAPSQLSHWDGEKVVPMQLSLKPPIGDKVSVWCWPVFNASLALADPSS